MAGASPLPRKCARRGLRAKRVSRSRRRDARQIPEGGRGRPLCPPPPARAPRLEQPPQSRSRSARAEPLHGRVLRGRVSDNRTCPRVPDWPDLCFAHSHREEATAREHGGGNSPADLPRFPGPGERPGSRSTTWGSAADESCTSRRAPVSSAHPWSSGREPISRPRGRARRGCRAHLGPCRRRARWALVVRRPRRSQVRCWRRTVLAGSQA